MDGFDAVNSVTPRLNDLMRSIEDVALDLGDVEVAFSLHSGTRVVITSGGLTEDGHYKWDVATSGEEQR